jgi:hypothetical protein
VSQISAVSRRLVMLPFRPIVVLMRPVLRRIDRSQRLSGLINSLSSSMATLRGLLLMVGSAIVAVSLIAHAVVLVALVTSDRYDRQLYWLCIPFALLHVGVLIGFTGTMLATPLGQGYKDK